MSDGTRTDNQSLKVMVTNEDDDGPVFDETINVYVDEDAALGDRVKDTKGGADDVLTVASDDSANIQENASVVLFSIIGGDPSGQFVINDTGQISVAKALDYEAQSTYELEIRATASLGNQGTGTVKVKLADVNDAPTGTNFTINVTEDGSEDLGPLQTMALLAGYDDDDPSHAVASVQLVGDGPVHGTLTDEDDDDTGLDSTGGWIYTPNADYNGADSLQITFTDDGDTPATSEVITVTVSVDPKDDAPVLKFKGVKLDNDEEAVGLPSASTVLANVIPKASNEAEQAYDGSEGVLLYTPPCWGLTM